MSTLRARDKFENSTERHTSWRRSAGSTVWMSPRGSLEHRIRLIEQYLKYFSGYDPGTADPKSSGVEDSLLLLNQLNQLSTKSSVVFDPPIERKDRLQEELSTVRASARCLAEEFKDLMSRLRWHTELCKSLRTIRRIEETEPTTHFFRAVVDIHDCVRTTAPEDMTREMANVIDSVVSALSPSMTRHDLLQMADKLFAAGLRTWSRPKNP